MERQNEYFIDQSVLFVLSAFETERKSKIVTKHGVYYSRDSVLSLIDKACMLSASTYEGRIQANRHNLKHYKKITLFIWEGLSGYPTHSPTHPDCVWILNHDNRFESLGQNRTRIHYDQWNIHIDVNVSMNILKKQRMRMTDMLYFYTTARARNKN